MTSVKGLAWMSGARCHDWRECTTGGSAESPCRETAATEALITTLWTLC